MKINLFKAVKSQFMNIPLPSSLNYYWNMGSLLGVCLIMQISTGILLSFHYVSSLDMSFESVMMIESEVWLGWLVRSLHSNGASLFFMLVFFHVSRGLYFASFDLKLTWLVGSVILFLMMGSAFMGYVLPWGQMSFWGATVITNLISVMPKGPEIVMWVWGGFSISGPTLSRFFSLHYLLPLLMSIVVVLHVYSLHVTGSKNPLGLSENSDKISFHPYYSLKDLLGLMLIILMFLTISLLTPHVFMDLDNWFPANPLSTPEHIQPEWYFLFAYTILRSVPSKLGGVVMLVMSVAVLMIVPFIGKQSCRFNPLSKVFYWVFVMNFLLLTKLGAFPVDSSSMLMVCQFSSVLYFLSILFPLEILKTSPTSRKMVSVGRS